jgi:hypothetical protein
MNDLRRSFEPHIYISHEVISGSALGSTKDIYMLYMTTSAWKVLGEPSYVKLAVNTRYQKIRVLPSEARKGSARRLSRMTKGGYKIGQVSKFVDAGMRIGRYLYKDTNVFVHE